MKENGEELYIYPATIVTDRYGGTYSGGTYTAWNLDPDEIPPEINESDIPCMEFWEENKIPVGLGATPDEALRDLYVKYFSTEGKDYNEIVR